MLSVQKCPCAHESHRVWPHHTHFNRLASDLFLSSLDVSSAGRRLVAEAGRAHAKETVIKLSQLHRSLLADANNVLAALQGYTSWDVDEESG